MNLLNKFYKASLRDVVLFFKRKLFPSNDWGYSLDNVVNDSKRMNFLAILDRYERYIRIVENKGINNFLNNIKDKKIFELGCGPLLGIAPIVLFKEASKYIYYEPNISINLLDNEEIKLKYLRPFWSELSANYAHKIDYLRFLSLLKNNTNRLNDLTQLTEKVDFYYSNSVLEHLTEDQILNFMKLSHKNSSENAISMHVVDFSSHGFARTPKNLEGLYLNPPDYTNKLINFLRRTDIESIIKKSGWKVKSILYRELNFNKDKIDLFWSEYKLSDLNSGTVVFLCHKE
jgi:hypothetical protein